MAGLSTLELGAANARLRRELQEVVDEYQVVNVELDAASSQLATLKSIYADETIAYKKAVQALWESLCDKGAVDANAKGAVTKAISIADGARRALLANEALRNLAHEGFQLKAPAGLDTSFSIPRFGTPRSTCDQPTSQQLREHAMITKERDDLTAEVSRLQQQLFHATKSNAALQQQLEERNRQFNVAEAEAADARAKLQLSEMQSAMAAHPPSPPTRPHHPRAQHGSISSSNKDDSDAQERTTAAVPSLRAALEESEAKLRTLSAQHAQLARSQAALRSELELAQDRYNSQAGVVAMLRDQVSDLSLQLNAADSARVEAIRQASATARTAEERIAGLASEVKSLRRQLAAITGTAASTEEQLAGHATSASYSSPPADAAYGYAGGRSRHQFQPSSTSFSASAAADQFGNGFNRRTSFSPSAGRGGSGSNNSRLLLMPGTTIISESAAAVSTAGIVGLSAPQTNGRQTPSSSAHATPAAGGTHVLHSMPAYGGRSPQVVRSASSRARPSAAGGPAGDHANSVSASTRERNGGSAASYREADYANDGGGELNASAVLSADALMRPASAVNSASSANKGFRHSSYLDPSSAIHAIPPQYRGRMMSPGRHTFS